MKKRIVFIAALLCGMCFTTASAQFKIGGKKINVGKVVQAVTQLRQSRCRMPTLQL